MSRVTSKLQVTVPKALAAKYGIQPGDDIRFEEAGEVIRVIPPRTPNANDRLGLDARLRLFDAATERQLLRRRASAGAPDGARSWTRGELYQRGAPSSD